MTTRVAFSGCLLLAASVAAVEAQGYPVNECRAVGLFVLDVAATGGPKITVVPSRLEVSYPEPAQTAREICFTVVIANGDKNDRLEQLSLKGFDSKLGRGGKPLLRAKRVHSAGGDLVSLEFADVPDWDPDGDGRLEDVVQSYDIEAKFKGKAVAVDPDIIIKKPGG